jgi:hypothetical protein
MNTNMHGKEINLFDVHPCWTQHGNPERIASGRGRKLNLSATHHGDHDQFWIIETNQDGWEVRRWHASAVAHIEWVTANPESKP